VKIKIGELVNKRLRNSGPGLMSQERLVFKHLMLKSILGGCMLSDFYPVVVITIMNEVTLGTK
jgi:hypothetical protein